MISWFSSCFSIAHMLEYVVHLIRITSCFFTYIAGLAVIAFCLKHKMTSSNWNIFRVTVFLCGEQWREVFVVSLIGVFNKRLSKQSWGWWFETPSCCSLWRYRNELYKTTSLFDGSLLWIWQSVRSHPDYNWDQKSFKHHLITELGT